MTSQRVYWGAKLYICGVEKEIGIYFCFMCGADMKLGMLMMSREYLAALFSCDVDSWLINRDEAA